MAWKHGASAHASTTIRCRCTVCRKAAAERQSKRNMRLQSTPVPEGSHGKTGYVTYGCRCEVCEEGVKDSNRKGWERERPLREQAKNSGKEWTGPELEIVARTDLKATKVAVMLGRTPGAVRAMRVLIRKDPRKINLAGIVKEEEA